MVEHLCHNDFLPGNLGGLVKPFLHKDTMPGRLASKVRHYVQSGEEMPFFIASQLRTYLADDRIFPGKNSQAN
jgi:hypothetical protein